MALYLGNRIVSPSIIVEKSDIITAENRTSSTITSDSKVWIEKISSGGESDFSINGSVSIDDTTKFATITGDGYIYKNNQSIFTAPTTSVEIQIKFRTTERNDDLPSSTKSKFFGTSITDSNSRLIIGSSWNGIDVRTFGTSYGGMVVSGSNWAFGTWYWIKVIITTTNCTVYWSLDGINWSSGYSISGVPNLSDIANRPRWMLGRMNYDTATVYDLNHCHIIADGNTYWWLPYTPIIESYHIINYNNISSNSLTGVSLQNISVNSSGTVKTVLSE